jgi:glycerophosphoryl diester phosphodiesterase
VKEHSLAELQRLDAGYHFSTDGVGFPWRGQGIRIMTFEELVLRLPDACFNVELKQASPDIVRPFWQLVERLSLHDRVLVAAARDEIVQSFRRVSRGRVATSAGKRETLRFWLAARALATRLLRVDYDALQVPVRHGPITVVDRAFIHAAHARGLHVHVWTIDDPVEMRRLLALGVDGLMSDRPDLLQQVLNAR